MPPVITNKAVPETRRACGRCGQLGHLSRTCKRPEKAHLKVGIEIEGYWHNSTFHEVVRKAGNWNIEGVSDGSLSRHTDFTSREFRTRPGSLGEAINQLSVLYPDGTDDKVGMHVHVSFEPSDVPLLATSAFFAFFDAQWREWGAAMNLNASHWFFKRLNGENQYCAKPNMADINHRHISSMQRYSQINFASLSHHRTVECRLLPMFRDAKIGVSAVEKLISIYETWLSEGKCEEFLSSCAKRVEVSVSDESAKIVKEIEMPKALRVESHSVAPMYVPQRLPGYALLYAGTAQSQLRSIGVIPTETW